MLIKCTSFTLAYNVSFTNVKKTKSYEKNCHYLFVVIIYYFHTCFLHRFCCRKQKRGTTTSSPQVEVKNVHKDIEETISKFNIKFENIVKAQIILESGNLTSIRAIRDNNIVGMKVAKQRPTTAINEEGHAIYSSIEDCLIDYALWQSQNAFKCRTEEQYLELLGRIYAEDPKYVEKLKRIIEKQKKQN